MKKILIFLPLLLCFFACDPDETPALEFSTSRIQYGNHPLQNMDLHLPANHNTDTKVIVLVHGGGWVRGSAPNSEVPNFGKPNQWALKPLLEEGYACAVMKYRTACQKVLPEDFGNDIDSNLNIIMEDIDLVIDHLKDNSETLGISNNHFQLLGESAGGHLVMSYGIRSDSDTTIRSVASMFGPTNLDAQDFKTALNSIPEFLVQDPFYILNQADNCESVTDINVTFISFLKSFSDRNDVKVNNPNPFLDTLSTTSDFNIQRDIPMFITHGEDDILVPVTQANSMLEAMQNKFTTPLCDENDFSCQLKLRLYENCDHGWTGNCNRTQIMNDVVKWMNAH